MRLEEIAKDVHAYSEAVEAVNKVFKTHGIKPSFTIGNGFAVADVPVSLANEVFSAKFYNFQHRKVLNLTTTRTLSYSIPASLKPHLDFVCCMDKFPNPNETSTLKSYSRPRLLGVTPESIAKNYNISQGYTSTSPKNSQAVASFLKQYFSPEDLKKFQNEFDIPSNPITKVIGTNDEKRPGGEASLDVQYITGKEVCKLFIIILLS